jgi:hypothetical protein
MYLINKNHPPKGKLMFKKSISFIVVIAVIILGGMSLVAQETPAPLDPDANACFEGGELFGRCDTSDFNADGVVSQDEKDYAYVYGWYLLRCRVGGFFTEEFCANILPPVFAEEAAVEPISTSICIAFQGISFTYAFGFDNSKAYSNETCEGNSFSVTMATVSQGSHPPDCKALLGDILGKYVLVGTVNGLDYYFCKISE